MVIGTLSLRRLLPRRPQRILLRGVFIARLFDNDSKQRYTYWPFQQHI